jgi:DNA-binding transcriptional regulator YiaG
MRNLTLGDKIRIVREEKLKMNQEEFAKLLKTTFASVSRYENNKRKPRAYFVREKLAELLDEYGFKHDELEV